MKCDHYIETLVLDRSIHTMIAEACILPPQVHRYGVFPPVSSLSLKASSIILMKGFQSICAFVNANLSPSPCIFLYFSLRIYASNVIFALFAVANINNVVEDLIIYILEYIDRRMIFQNPLYCPYEIISG